MNRLLLFAVAVGGLHCTAFGGRGFPPPLFPAAPVAGDWPDVGAAVLEDVGTLELRLADPGDGKGVRLIAVLDHRVRIKVLSESGIAAANVELPIDGFSSVSRIEARTVSPSGDVESWNARSLQVRPWPGADQRARELSMLRVEIPGATVGGLIDYRYERVFTDGNMTPPWVFGGALPTVRSELSVVVPDGIAVDFRVGKGERAVQDEPLRRKLEDGRERLVFVRQNIAPYYEEPDRPHLTRIAEWVAVVAVRVDKGETRERLESWEDVRAKVERLFARVGGEPGVGTPEQRFAAVRDAIVPVGVNGVGVLRPMAAAGLLNREPACSRDAAALLGASLVGIDLPAYPALLAAPVGPALIEGFPSVFPFARVVIAVDVNTRNAADPSCKQDPVSRGLLCTVAQDSFAFLDPLCSKCRFGELPPELTGGRALVFLPDRTRFVDVPLDPPERNRTLTQYRYAFDLDGSLAGNMSAELAGAPARTMRARIDAASDGQAKANELGRWLFGEASATQLAELELIDYVNLDKPIRMRAAAKGRSSKLGYERYELQPSVLVGPAFPAKMRSVRRYDALLQGPLWIESVASVEVPVGYKVEVPQMATLVRPFAEYAAGWAMKDRVLTFSRRLIVKQQRISAAEWASFRELVDAIEATETTGARLTGGS